MHYRFALFLILALLLVALTPLEPVLAARGTPGSAEFGYGAHLNQDGPYAVAGVHLASDMQLDWMGVDLSWRTIAPKAGSSDWSRLDPILEAAAHSQIPVLISLSDAPDWALGPEGPAADLTVQFIEQLLKRYPEAVQAIELFPGANTQQGWGSVPDAKAYLKVLSAVKNAIKKDNPSVRLVAAGLKPVQAGAENNAQAIDDTSFLQSLYENGLAKAVTIVSIQANELTGEPLQAPDQSEIHVLRHYEIIRQVMLNNGHESALIWITHLTPPNGMLNGDDQKYRDTAAQNDWLNQAYSQLKSQLYIGVAFLSGLNPPASGQTVSLIDNLGNYHPFYRTLRELISINRSDPSSNRPGRAKDQPLLKSAK